MATRPLEQLMNRLRASALKQDGGSLADGELLECFVVLHDEAAFEGLVRRHGPMVYGVCRRILGNDADAEDAFQATFLVLVRKAASIRPRGMVSNWLYGVAHNTAIKAKAMNHQRQRKEREAGTMPKAGQNEDVWSQVQSLVDTELSHLPDKYRVPIVLCDLEGKTIKEAVHHLGWPQGTVATRLTRGRALLARRLSKHGLQLSAGLVAGALGQGAASASVPAALTAATIQAGCLLAAGKAATASGASAAALALTDGVLKTMLLAKLKVTAAAVLVTTLLTAGIGALSYNYFHAEGASNVATAQPSVKSVQEQDNSNSQAKLLPESPSSVESEVAAPSISKDSDSGNSPVQARTYILRSDDLTAEGTHWKAFSDLCGLKPAEPEGKRAIGERSAPNGAGPAGKPALKLDVKDKPTPPLVAMIHTWSSERLTLVVHKGKYYLIGPLRSDGALLSGQSIRIGPVTWKVTPDGAKLLLIGCGNEKNYMVTIHGLLVTVADVPHEFGEPTILPPASQTEKMESSPSGPAGAGWFHSAP
jgi:RNA polymerase sigma factor (sigma-70 family)